MRLDVHLGERHVGTLSRAGGGDCDFAYLPELVERAAAGEDAPALSLALPVRAEPYGPAETRAFVDGLLPSGKRRALIAHELCVDPGDCFAMISQLGRDCPGAVVFVPQGEQARRAESEPAWLGEGELEQLVTAPQRGLFDPAREERMRFALPGPRHRLALVRGSGDRWAWPGPGSPSTHVLEPEPFAPPDQALNSMACSTAMRELGLPVVETGLTMVHGWRCLVWRRADRRAGGADAATGVERVHSETFLQALGVEPGGARARSFGFAEACRLLLQRGAEQSVEALFGIAFCNHLLGNRRRVYDERLALLHGEAGTTLRPYPPLSSDAADHPALLAARKHPVYELIRTNLRRAGLAPDAIGGETEMRGSVLRAVLTASRLGDALRAVIWQAREEGWYRRVLTRIPPNAVPMPIFGPEGLSLYGDYDEDEDDEGDETDFEY